MSEYIGYILYIGLLIFQVHNEGKVRLENSISGTIEQKLYVLYFCRGKKKLYEKCERNFLTFAFLLDGPRERKISSFPLGKKQQQKSYLY